MSNVKITKVKSLELTGDVEANNNAVKNLDLPNSGIEAAGTTNTHNETASAHANLSARAPAAHASTHHTGGADALTAANIGGDAAGTARPPTAHAATHTDGTDDIQSATNAVKGLATAAQIAALEATRRGMHSEWTVYANESDYTAINEEGGSTTNASFSTLMNAVLAQCGNGSHIHLKSSTLGATRHLFMVDSPILVDLAITITGEGNPVTFIRPVEDAAFEACFIVGSVTPTSSIVTFEKIRFSASLSGAHEVSGVKFVDAAEPVLRWCEFTGFTGPGVIFTRTDNSSHHWMQVESCWFVMTHGKPGIRMDYPTAAGAGKIREMHIFDSMFTSTTGSGNMIEVLRNAQMVQIDGCRFSSSASDFRAVRFESGAGVRVSNSYFRHYAAARTAIAFDSGVTETNFHALIQGNHGPAGGMNSSTGVFVEVSANASGIAFGPNEVSGFGSLTDASVAQVAPTRMGSVDATGTVDLTGASTRVAEAERNDEAIPLKQLFDNLQAFSMKMIYGDTTDHPVVGSAGSLVDTPPAEQSVTSPLDDGANLIGTFLYDTATDFIRAGKYFGRFWCEKNAATTVATYIELGYYDTDTEAWVTLDTSAEEPVLGTNSLRSYRLGATITQNVQRETADIYLGVRYYLRRTGQPPVTVTTRLGDPYDTHLETPGLGGVGALVTDEELTAGLALKVPYTGATTAVDLTTSASVSGPAATADAHLLRRQDGDARYYPETKTLAVDGAKTITVTRPETTVNAAMEATATVTLADPPVTTRPYSLRVYWKQDGTGDRVLTIAGNTLGWGTYTLSTGANATDYAEAHWNGTVWVLVNARYALT